MWLVSLVLVIQTFTLEKGETWESLFQRAGLSYRESYVLAESLGKFISPTRRWPGEELVVCRDTAGIKWMKYFTRDAGYFIDTGLVVTRIPERQILTYIQGVVDTTSLYEAVLARGGTPYLVYQFTEEIFPWEINFHVEVRRGDTFEILTYKRYVEDRFIGYGTILYARYGDSEAYYFEPYDGYYEPSGRSLQRMFLRAPLSYVRVSSGYTKYRYHPILHVVRPHYGVDYVAPLGTPVRAIGSGIVKYVGWRGGYGKQVVISHPKGYESYYSHLSRYAKGIRKGVKVKQGQIIGYVGSTGLSTGPHLDFRIKHNGRWINPLKLKVPHVRILKGKYKSMFTKHKREIDLIRRFYRYRGCLWLLGEIGITK